MGFSHEAMERVFTDTEFNLSRLLVYYEDWATILNCLGICFRMPCVRIYDARTISELKSAVTGKETDVDRLVMAARRAYTVYRLVNVKEGFSRKDDRFPRRWFEPLTVTETGEKLEMMDYYRKKKITPEVADKILDEYYEEKGWDIQTGIPTRKTVNVLGLSEICRNMDLP